MFEQINEKIEVVARFRRNGLEPYKFLWQSREILIKKINLAYSAYAGRSKIYFFAVSDGTSYFKLQFNTENLRWTLLETYVD